MCRHKSKYHYKIWAEGRILVCSGMWTNWLIRPQVQKWEHRTESEDKMENSHVLQVLWNRHQATKPARHCCRLRDSQWSVCLGPSKDSCGISIRIAVHYSATWRRRLTEHLGVVSFSVISPQSASSSLAFNSFSWPTRVKAQERCTNPRFLTSQGKITVSAVRSLMSEANLKHCHSRSHHHISGDRKPGVSSDGTGGQGPSIRCPSHHGSHPYQAILTAFYRAVWHTPWKKHLTFKTTAALQVLSWNIFAALLKCQGCCYATGCITLLYSSAFTSPSP